MVEAHDWEQKKLLSLKALQGRGFSKWYIFGVGRIGKSLEDSIEIIYYVSGVRHSFLSVYPIYDKGNEVKLPQKSALSLAFLPIR